MGISNGEARSASCRIRFYRFLQYLSKEFQWEEYKSDNNFEKCKKDITNFDILYIQKLRDVKLIEFVEYAKNKNISSIYDIDDKYTQIEENIIQTVSGVTTDTEERAKWLRKTKVPVFVVPDTIDYVTRNDTPLVIGERIKTIGTFGFGGGIFEKEYLNNVPNNYLKGCISNVINPEVIKCSLIKWNFKTFLQSFKKFDVCLLAHGLKQFDLMKSNNRLLVAMAIGMPAIVSNTPAYRETMLNTKCDFLIAQEPKDVPNIIKTIAPEQIRKEIGKKFRRYVWDKFSPEESSKVLAKVFLEVKNLNWK
jgi:glycosyltransferase involved in cell wall biosynthesis